MPSARSPQVPARCQCQSLSGAGACVLQGFRHCGGAGIRMYRDGGRDKWASIRSGLRQLLEIRPRCENCPTSTNGCKSLGTCSTLDEPDNSTHHPPPPCALAHSRNSSSPLTHIYTHSLSLPPPSPHTRTLSCAHTHLRSLRPCSLRRLPLRLSSLYHSSQRLVGWHGTLASPTAPPRQTTPPALSLEACHLQRSQPALLRASFPTAPPPPPRFSCAGDDAAADGSRPRANARRRNPLGLPPKRPA